VSSFLAVRIAVEKERFVTVPVGAVIETTEDLQEQGLLIVTLNGEDLLVFHRDMRERTESVPGGQFAKGA
jgi:hypothetical protein